MALLDVGAFRAEVIEDLSANGHGPRQIVRVAGDIDVVTAPSLEAALRVAFAERCTVVVDLGDVTFMASAGIAELVRARIRLRSVDGDLVVMGAQPNVRHVFALCGLQDLLGDASESPTRM